MTDHTQEHKFVIAMGQVRRGGWWCLLCVLHCHHSIVSISLKGPLVLIVIRSVLSTRASIGFALIHGFCSLQAFHFYTSEAKAQLLVFEGNAMQVIP